MSEPTTPTAKRLFGMDLAMDAHSFATDEQRDYWRRRILDIEREARDPWLNVALDRERQRDAERALADQLAEALRSFIAIAERDGWHTRPDIANAVYPARNALAAYEEARRGPDMTAVAHLGADDWEDHEDGT